MIDKNMSPAVRRAMEREKAAKLAKRAENIPDSAQASEAIKSPGQVPKTTEKYDKNYDKKFLAEESVCEIAQVEKLPKMVQSGAIGPSCSAESGIPVGRPTLNPTVFEALHQELTREISGKFRLSPATCRHPDDLCRGCQEFQVCG